ncbi:RESISTANCE PROTEIN RGA2 putative-RELATED [Salix purpurea]|uniref:RESISTANCE PROTEIN RGA2 putative-RELATED n=1 Tax=Salix purpurea TaxID=77065 RepID=A0A9Q0VR69_SALPP|nr:RESISTANCE PROTEIN RGA2 putative-RELATED [Salix purpurea]
MGRALRDKSVDGWEVASTKLKNNQLQHMERNGEQKNAYGCLKLSYDYLNHEKTKLVFLLCCLFPEDYNIPIEDLTRYAIGYGLHQDVESIEDARRHVYVEIRILKDCCMLLSTETEEKVKMHGLVRDVAIQIAYKEHGFMVKAGIGLKEWPRSNKSFEGCTTISLMGNQLTELPEGLVFPQLKVLLLELDSDLNVQARFFERMTEIEVLSLKGGCLSLQSLEFSTNLQSLLLIDCECNDLIWLRKLPRLKILGFIGCSSLEELPDEIGELKELWLLDMTGCSSLRRIPVNLIGRLKKLEELVIGDNSFEGWDVVRCDSTEEMNASLTELNLLSHLVVLSLKITDEIGELKEIRLMDVTGSRDARTLLSILAKWQQALNNLTSVKIEDCKSLEEVFDLGEGSSEVKELRLLSSLTRLELKLLPELKCIWKGPTRHVSLRSLIHLELQSLYKLTFIFTPFTGSKS